MSPRTLRPTSLRAWTLPLVIITLLLMAGPARAKVAPSPVLTAAADELARSMKMLRDQSEPPYFLSYEITQSHRVAVESSFGTLTDSSDDTGRLLDIDLRVGSYDMDNSRQLRGGFGFGFLDNYSQIPMPVENDPDAIRATLWYHTDKKYKRAVENLTKVRTNVQVKVEQEDQSADFSKEPAEKYVEAVQELDVDRADWEVKIKGYTAPFAEYGNIYGAQAFFTALRRRTSPL